MAFHIKLKPLLTLGGVSLLEYVTERCHILRNFVVAQALREQKQATGVSFMNFKGIQLTWLGHATFQKLVPGVEIVAKKPGVTFGN